VQPVREELHAALLPGVALPKGAQRAASVRLQGAQGQGKCQIKPISSR